ncbi:MAG: phenylalanine--tRNA ligase subunit beta [Candidatus Pacebacteria bacterium]|nr:phenylalanine--tRNA ligase subunit beta [Candidatus Paceibacterota bacterium]
MKISYNWLKWYVPQAPEVNALAEAIVFHAFEVESVEAHKDDFILDIKTLPDRNHDCLSHQGIAREVSAILNISFVDPAPKYKIPESKPTELSIDIQTPICRRYMGRIVRNVKVGPSPEWVVKHLESIGQRSINNIVDATNLTMFNCGQPCHAFDLGKTKEGIIIRNANTGEKITLLTDEEKELTNTMAVISDASGNALAVAGVKGGKFAEVNNETTDILIEIANFDPTSVRKTAKALNIQTDSTKRFENDLSPTLAPYAMQELSALLVEMFPGAVFEDIVDIYTDVQEVKTISVSSDYINKKLGSNFSTEEIENVWKRLKFEYVKNEGEFTITQPALRLDLCEPHDFVEEVGRISGYDKIEASIPKLDWKPEINNVFYKTLAVKKHFIDLGHSEVMTYSFRNKGEVEMLKTASDKKFLRTNLKDGLTESLVMNTLNAPLLGIDQIKLFEIGTVFSKPARTTEGVRSGGDKEELHVAYNEKKQVIEMTLDEFCQKNNIVVGDSYGDLLSTKDYQLKTEKFTPWSLYPFITRDVAVWVPAGIESSKVYQVIKEQAGTLLVREPRLVDTFTKDEKTSYAFRLVFQSFEKTLTDAEVEPYTTAIYKALQNSGFEIR